MPSVRGRILDNVPAGGTGAEGTPESIRQEPEDVLSGAWWSQVHAVYQPVVQLDSLEVVGFEALARGPAGSALASPAALFEHARATGRLPELDWACRCAAYRGALKHGVPSRLGLLVNFEPAALNTPPPPGQEALLDRAMQELPIVMEITERALTLDPAGLLRSAARARERGWRVALDDVGADVASLALLPFLAPEVIKLDLRLVQDQTTDDIAAILAAVVAQSERTGALVLAEGIETAEHARAAERMGATLGQGWFFGRPGPLPTSLPRVRPQRARAAAVQPLPAAAALAARQLADKQAIPLRTPFGMVQQHRSVLSADRSLLQVLTQQLEREALAAGDAAVFLVSFPSAELFTPETASRYDGIADACAFTAALIPGLPVVPASRVRTVGLHEQDPLCGEWTVTVVAPHCTAALIARQNGTPVAGRAPDFDYLLTHDRDTVLAAAELLLRRVPAG